MAANTNPVFGLVPNQFPVTLNAANTARDGSGSNFFTIVTAGTNGTRVDAVTFTSSSATVGASVLKVCRIWLTDTSGANLKLIGEILLPLITSSNTVIGATATFTFPYPKTLKSGQLMKGTISLCATAADNVDAIATAWDY